MKQKTLGVLIFLATIIALCVPIIFLASAGVNSDTFDATVTIENTAPSIYWVEHGDSATPSEGTTASISIDFNVTDDNTVSNMDLSSAFINISKIGETSRTSASCASVANSTDDKIQTFRCTASIYYYDAEGNWTICAYIADNSGGNASNCTAANFTINPLDAVDVINASIAFSGSAGEANVGPDKVVVNNTGNKNYVSIRLNATYLNASATAIIGVGNFSVNVSNSADGEALTENAFLAITDSTLNKGASSTKDLYFYLDIPATIEDGSYSSNRAWVIDPSTS